VIVILWASAASVHLNDGCRRFRIRQHVRDDLLEVVDRVEQFKGYDGTVLRTTLTDEQRAKLQATLQGGTETVH